MPLIRTFSDWLRVLVLGPALTRARIRNREAAERLDATLREVLKK